MNNVCFRTASHRWAGSKEWVATYANVLRMLWRHSKLHSLQFVLQKGQRQGRQEDRALPEGHRELRIRISHGCPAKYNKVLLKANGFYFLSEVKLAFFLNLCTSSFFEIRGQYFISHTLQYLTLVDGNTIDTWPTCGVPRRGRMAEELFANLKSRNFWIIVH